MGSSNRGEFVKQNLDQFLEKYRLSVLIGDIDEICLSYMVGILEELGSTESKEDIFDVHQFIEMMEAYLPGFGQIDSLAVSEWMFDLSVKLVNYGKLGQNGLIQSPPKQTLLGAPNSYKTQVDNAKKTSISGKISNPNNPFKDVFVGDFPEVQAESGVPRNSHPMKSRTQSWSSDDVQNDDPSLTSLPSHKHEKRWRTQSSSSTASSDMASNMSGEEETDEAIQLLVEMFPNTCVMEINHCLSVANGNTDHAAQLILTRQECGQSLTQNAAKNVKKPGSKNSSCNFLDDHNVKKAIINKYSYVDVDLDKKEYKPSLPKVQDKKLVRYLDSKIVSTRGERFTEIKKEDDEKLKKTFVNLKPAKQYRFH